MQLLRRSTVIPLQQLYHWVGGLYGTHSGTAGSDKYTNTITRMSKTHCTTVQIVVASITTASM